LVFSVAEDIFPVHETSYPRGVEDGTPVADVDMFELLLVLWVELELVLAGRGEAPAKATPETLAAGQGRGLGAAG
jgi:hypothetical protein